MNIWCNPSFHEAVKALVTFFAKPGSQLISRTQSQSIALLRGYEVPAAVGPASGPAALLLQGTALCMRRLLVSLSRLRFFPVHRIERQPHREQPPRHPSYSRYARNVF